MTNKALSVIVTKRSGGQTGLSCRPFTAEIAGSNPVQTIMSKPSRQKANRRDRRKAKESNWRREGRSNPKRIGHGGSGQVLRGLIDQTITTSKTRQSETIKQQIVMKSKTLGEPLELFEDIDLPEVDDSLDVSIFGKDVLDEADEMT